MIIPDKIKVGPYWIAVEQVEKISDTDEDIWGEVGALEKRIRLKKSLPEDLKAQTFIHELLHAADGIFRLGIGSEDKIDRLSAVLFMILEENGMSK